MLLSVHKHRGGLALAGWTLFSFPLIAYLTSYNGIVVSEHVRHAYDVVNDTELHGVLGAGATCFKTPDGDPETCPESPYEFDTKCTNTGDAAVPQNVPRILAKVVTIVTRTTLPANRWSQGGKENCSSTLRRCSWYFICSDCEWVGGFDGQWQCGNQNGSPGTDAFYTKKPSGDPC